MNRLTTIMNKKHFIVAVFAALGMAFSASGQRKVGDSPTTINVNSVLEMEATNKGMLLPRVALTATNNVAPLTAHVAGMAVYNIATAGDVTPGYYYNDGAQWVRLASGGNGGNVSLPVTNLVSNNSPAGNTPGQLLYNTNPNIGLPVGPVYWDGNNWVPLKATATESWFNAATNAAATSNTQNIYQMGNVGIGTTTPQEKLDIEGNGQVAQSGYFRFPHANQTDTNDGKIGSGLFASGLNIIGTKTGTTGNREIRTWGNVYVGANDGASLGVGTATPDASAKVDVSSTTQGFLPPRMTTTQRDAIANPAKGLVLYNTTADCLQINKGTTAAPNWVCMDGSGTGNNNGAIVFVVCPNCLNEKPFMVGRSGLTITYQVTNNTFNPIGPINFSNALTLSGAGATGMSVVAGQNSAINIASGATATLTFNLSGTLTTLGTLTASFSHLGLTCVQSTNVVNEANATNGKNGTSAALANYSCNAIKVSYPSSTDGVYWIDIDGCDTQYSPMQAQCDMTTDGGGWTMVLNFMRSGGNPATNFNRTTFPLITSSTLGANESTNTTSWGGINGALSGKIPFTTVRFQGKTGAHNREMHFKSSSALAVNYMKYGLPCPEQSYWATLNSFTPLSNHSTVLPGGLTWGTYNGCGNAPAPGTASIQGAIIRRDANNNVTNVWAIGTSVASQTNLVWVQWTIDEWYDDFTGNGGNQPTMHRVWVR